MNITTYTRPDGLYISAQAPWPQLVSDETLRRFADGFVIRALDYDNPSLTLADLLHHPALQTYPLLTILLALEAEVYAVANGKQPVFPLAGFLRYRAKLSPDKFPLHSVYLPRPVCTNQHYLLNKFDDGFCVAVQLTLHPRFKIAKNVRLATGSPHRRPTRLTALERHLEQQVLDKDFIRLVVTVGGQACAKLLTKDEQEYLIQTLSLLVEENTLEKTNPTIYVPRYADADFSVLQPC